ncbi:uncharacterized protein LOC125017056 [Mugil cephalus]|uniref:uncharacterized protein LOC125017056 n=1 Tax=Mugil cephalus TaxID=48193 RepID=UPI001FB79E46|nr:uncharacterized protein LOC125017056 [Mugil cephalus]
MANPTDAVNPQPQSGKHNHTQESGDAGLSSNMEHNFDENYKGTAIPVADTGSFVRPFHKQVAEKEEMMPLSLIFQPPEPACAKEGFKHLGQHLHAAQNELLTDESKEEAVMASPRNGTISNKEGGGEPKMDARMNTDPPKGRPSKKRRRSNSSKTMGLAVMVVVSLCVTPCVGSEAVQCFTCTDQARCKNLTVIYGTSDDTQLYRRLHNETFPRCSGIPPLHNSSCIVCHGHSNIIITCLRAYDIDVEDKRGHISNISVGCDQEVTSRSPLSEMNSPPSPGHGHIGLYCSIGFLFMIICGAVYRHWKIKSRTENQHQQTKPV